MGELAPLGNERGMVMDFSFIKEEMVKHIHDNIDHALVLWNRDVQVERVLSIVGLEEADTTRYSGLVPPVYTIDGVKLYLMSEVPTAENMAKHFFDVIQTPIEIRSNGRAFVGQMDVYETPNCLARYPHVPTHQHIDANGFNVSWPI